MRPIFNQNVIAVVWDLDKTLSQGYMQAPLFRRYGVDEETFWREVNGLGSAMRARAIGGPGVTRVNEETIYLNHMLEYVRSGSFAGLTNATLRELGSEISFFPGLPHALTRLRERVESNREYQRFGITLEHYIVSTGLREMIIGSAIGPLVDGIWACEFAEAGPQPGYLSRSEHIPSGSISQVAYAIDNTTKTRAIFEINKGTNRHPDRIHVNSYMRPEDRRVPIPHMIYVADGPSDIPVFSVVKGGGGRALAVYPTHATAAFRQANDLQFQGRVHGVAEADYTDGSHASLWLEAEIDRIATGIVSSRQRELAEQVLPPAVHIVSPGVAATPEEREGTAALNPSSPLAQDDSATPAAGGDPIESPATDLPAAVDVVRKQIQENSRRSLPAVGGSNDLVLESPPIVSSTATRRRKATR